MHPPDIILLLTATVDPGDMAFVALKEPAARRQEYCYALKNWLGDFATPPIVFCENSGEDLGWVEKIARDENPYRKTIESFSFHGNDYPRHRGKGYGEIGIISHALGKSRLIHSNTRVLKVTGRYFVKNIYRLMQRISDDKEISIFADLRRNLSWADSRVFCTTADFLKTYLIPLQNEADDSASVTFECLLARAIHAGMFHSMQWAMLPCTPIIQGTSGTVGFVYSTSTIATLRRELFRLLKSAVLSR